MMKVAVSFFRPIAFLVLIGLYAMRASGGETLVTSPGAGTFSVPNGVMEITVEVWGAGGSGGYSARGGGGGGAFNRKTVAVTPGDSIPYFVGAGAPANTEAPGDDTWFASTTELSAAGGQSALNDGSREGASGGDTGLYRGGDGASGVVYWSLIRGGGGGSSAGSQEDGTSASGGDGAIAPLDGGAGGKEGGTAWWVFGAEGEPGMQPGGGGGGGGAFSPGGRGGHGQIRISWESQTVCSDIYTAPDGINNNLPESRQLDLSVFNPRSPAPWPSNNVIPTGNHVYPTRDFTDNNVNVSVNGRARVLVDGDLTISGNNFTMNTDGDAADLLLIVDGDLTFKNNAELNAVVYVTGSIDFKNNSAIVGALAAEGSIDIGGGNSELTYDDEASGSVDFGGACVTDETDPELDHLQIVHPGVGLTCQASEVTILACADALCSSLYTDPVDVVMGPSGWAPSADFSINGGSATISFQRSSEEAVTLGVSAAYPLPENGVVCKSADGTNSCDIEFQDAGFFFSLPDLRSGVEDTFTMAALEKDEQSGQCIAMFEGQDLDVGFSSSYLIPGLADAVAGYPVLVNGTPVNNDGNAWSPVKVSFDENGEVKLPIQYNDAGQVGLSAIYQESGQPDGGTLTISGSDSFVTAPYGVCLIPEKQCSAVDLSCTDTHVAGTPLAVTPKAYRWTSDVESMSCSEKLPSPSFALTGLSVSHDAVLPEAGGPGSGLGTIDYGDGVQELIFTEVGIFDAHSLGISGGYLGQDVPESDPMRSPRLIPEYLEVTTLMPGEFAPAYPDDPSVPECSGFTYQGQAFGWNSDELPQLQIEARNAEGQLTLNYTHPDMISQLDAEQFEVQVPAQDRSAGLDNGDNAPFALSTGNTSLTAGTVGESEPGIALYTFNEDDRFVYAKEPETRTGPFFPDLAFVLDGLEGLDEVPANNIPQDGLLIEPGADFEIFYGRINLENAYGPETSELEIPVRAEIFQDGQFKLNAQENCWTYNLDEDSTVDYSGSSLDSSDTAVVDVNDTGLTLLNGRPDITGSNDYRLRLSAPGEGNVEGEGNTGIRVGLKTGNDWLKDFWDPDQPDTLLNPSALATFGVYRGHDRIIYWREVID